MTYEELGALTKLDSTRLSRAAGGVKLPSEEVVLAFNRACAGPEDVLELWRRARDEVHPRRGLLPAPRLDLVLSRADLAAKLYNAYVEGEAHSVRDLERRAETRAREFGLLPRSTAHRIIQRKSTPTSEQQLRAFLAACGVPDGEHPQWVEAWRRAERQHEVKSGSTSTSGERKAIDHTEERATQDVRAAGFEPLETFRGALQAWTCRCTKCRETVRIRLVDVIDGTARCAACEWGRGPDERRGVRK